MISSTSLHSPQKTSGLFDIGFAGDNTDVTSWDLNATTDHIDHSFSLNSVESASFATSDSVTGGADGKLDSIHLNTMDSFDLLDPLADLETDQLMDDSLDAFINLEEFLTGGTFFDEAANVKELTEVPTVVDINLTTVDAEFFIPPESCVSKSRKRKAVPEGVTVLPVKTSMFEIPLLENSVAIEVNPPHDHDYTAKNQKGYVTSGAYPQSSTKGNAISNNKPIIETTSWHSEPSTSSDGTLTHTEGTKTDKQAIRRIKNNVASKKSREQRKQKFADLDLEAQMLVQANEELRQKIVELEKEAKEMKAKLVLKMTGK